MTSKLFHIYEIMSAYSGILFPAAYEGGHGIDGVYNVLDFMCGEDLHTVALPRVRKEVAPYIKAQCPWIETATLELKEAMQHSSYHHGDGKFDEIAAKVVAPYETWHALIPMHHEDHEVLNPVEDIERLVGNADNVIEINLSEPSQSGDLPPSETE